MDSNCNLLNYNEMNLQKTKGLVCQTLHCNLISQIYYDMILKYYICLINNNIFWDIDKYSDKLKNYIPFFFLSKDILSSL